MLRGALNICLKLVVHLGVFRLSEEKTLFLLPLVIIQIRLGCCLLDGVKRLPWLHSVARLFSSVNANLLRVSVVF